MFLRLRKPFKKWKLKITQNKYKIIFLFYFKKNYYYIFTFEVLVFFLFYNFSNEFYAT